ncbi:MAG: ABC transporter permease [Bosea sp.]|jgi:ABC-type dipeptide/oligopeptide/nickel transport system permease subunit|uniref:ABC transporter permease n=1 Tax=Hyphomicrobiales TaxID=356 RepID=UPI0008346E13|nr:MULTISPECIES: ABC transporter permease [Hyphomicrobiales]MCP4561845.1 ABC transporter permease [Bosea sp. (in: a-proteobacteria)]MCP4738194.1 ABC transporter permease [Bosea sp. (in: a-proteobacteria)]MDX3804850.1 ABC transporter permease [Bosea sp. (in: a-proteobacteria)]
MTPTGTGQSISPRSAKRRRRAKGGVATAMAVAILAVIVGVALLAPVLAPYDPYEVDLSAALQPPGSAHLLGTDMQGRDLLSRIMYGTRLTLLTSLTALVSGSVVGALLGLAAVFFPSSDAVIGRLLDILLSFPAILFGLALGASLGPGLLPVTIALSIATVPEVGRIARAAGLTIARQEYMQSGRAIGLGKTTLFFKYLAWNCMPTIFVFLTLRFGFIILLGAGLNFLGLGAAPPAAELGVLAAEGRNVLAFAPHVATYPSLTIFLLVLSLNVLGDVLRDKLDKRLL